MHGLCVHQSQCMDCVYQSQCMDCVSISLNAWIVRISLNAWIVCVSVSMHGLCVSLNAWIVCASVSGELCQFFLCGLAILIDKSIGYKHQHNYLLGNITQHSYTCTDGV